MNKKNTMVLSDTNPVRSVNFVVSYQEEEFVTEGMLIAFFCKKHTDVILALCSSH